jgi:hypothetical protein
MKKIIQHLFLPILAFLLISGATFAQERGNAKARVSPNASVSQTIGTTVVSITYGRPGIKGRNVNELVNDPQNGEVWRTGANEATAITFSEDVMFGGSKAEAGTYFLYTIPNGDTWTIILNKKMSWGTQYDAKEDYLRVPAASVDTNAPEMEWFMMYFDNLSNTKAHLNLHWGALKVMVPISIGSM